MSIVLIGVQPDLALVVTDTVAMSPDGLRSIAKSFPLPHIDAVLAGRGIGRALSLLAAAAAVSGDDFDRIVEWLPAELGRLLDHHADDIALLPERDRRTEVFLVGWSPDREKLVACVIHRAADGSTTTTVYEPDDAGNHVVMAPHDDFFGPIPTLADLDNGGFIEVARRQIDLMNNRWSPGSAGGDLVISVVKRGNVISQRIVLDAPQPLSAAA